MKNKTIWILLVITLVALAVFLVMRNQAINSHDVQANASDLLAATQPSTASSAAVKAAAKEKADIAKKKVCGTPLESCLSKGNAGYIMFTCSSIAPTRNKTKWTSKDWGDYYKCVTDKAVTDSPKCTQAHIACLEKQS